MRSRLILSLLGLAMLCSAPAKARDVIRLQPTSKWVVNYAEDTCRLGREFGAGPQKVTLILEQFVPGDRFNLSFVGAPIKPLALTRLIEANVRFGPAEEKIETSGTAATIGALPAFIVDPQLRMAPLSKAEKSALQAARNRRDMDFELPPLGAARERGVTWVELSGVLSSDLVLETGPMDKPLEALRACSWDTIRSWGLPVEQQKNLRRKARPTTVPANWFSSADYPRDLQIAGFEGNVHFRVIVDEAGKPVSCRVQSATRPKAFEGSEGARAFEEVICRGLMKRARFHPALDVTGKPVRSYWRQSAYFRLAS